MSLYFEILNCVVTTGLPNMTGFESWAFLFSYQTQLSITERGGVSVSVVGGGGYQVDRVVIQRYGDVRL